MSGAAGGWSKSNISSRLLASTSRLDSAFSLYRISINCSTDENSYTVCEIVPSFTYGEMTINDPKNYTGPWRYQVKTSTPYVRHFKRMSKEDTEFYGWKNSLFSGITEAICAPMNEVGDFNKRIRDRAIFGDNVPNYQK